jgi:23S rRNA pseudouridine955/2504/2580 synthase/23S rRNA pseudouridine1911/1915/1917 synthase
LDRPTYGLVLFAKKKSVLKNLSEQFANRTTEKKYIALTKNAPSNPNTKLSHWHFKNTKLKKAELFSTQQIDTSLAELIYTTRKYRTHCEWDITLLTGKYHQIRAQLSYENCPIIGDTFYGSEETYRENAIALQSYLLCIDHPTTNERMRFEIAKINY